MGCGEGDFPVKQISRKQGRKDAVSVDLRTLTPSRPMFPGSFRRVSFQVWSGCRCGPCADGRGRWRQMRGPKQPRLGSGGVLRLGSWRLYCGPFPHGEAGPGLSGGPPCTRFRCSGGEGGQPSASPTPGHSVTCVSQTQARKESRTQLWGQQARLQGIFLGCTCSVCD